MQILFMRVQAAQAVIAAEGVQEAIQTAQAVLAEAQATQAAQAEVQAVRMALTKLLAIQGQALTQLQIVMQHNRKCLVRLKD
jgi:hypothetical protein